MVNTNEIIIRKKESNLKGQYSLLDGAKVIFYLLLVVAFTSLLYNTVISVIANLSDVTVDSINDLNYVKAISLIIIPLAYIIFFVVYNKLNKINSSYACGLKSKITLLPISISLVIGLIAVLFIAPFINMVDFGLGKLGYNPDSSLPFNMYGVGGLFLGIFLMAVLPAISEELIFRGIVQKAMLKNYKPVTAIIFTAIIFTLFHGSLQQTLFQFILGICLGYVAFMGGNLIYSIILHFINNTLIILLSQYNAFIYLDSSTSSYSNFFQIIFPILLLMVGICLIGLLFWVLYYLNSKLRVLPSELKNNNTKIMVDGSYVSVSKSTFKNFFKNTDDFEKIFLISSIVMLVLIWLANTISVFIVG